MSRTPYQNIPSRLPRELASVLTGVRFWRRFWVAVFDLGVLITTVGAVVLCSCLFDRFIDVPGAWRVPLPVLAMGALCFTGGRLLLRLFRRTNYAQIAHTLDQASGDPRGHLRSVLDLSPRRETSSFFLDRSISKAADLWRGQKIHRFIERRTPLWSAAAALALLGLLAGLWQIPYMRAELLLQRFLNPTGNYMRPSATWFEIEPLYMNFLQSGDDLTIRARLRGCPATSPSPAIFIRQKDGSSTLSLSPQDDGTWRIQLNNLRQDLQWHLFMNDARSQMVHTRVMARPTILSASVTCEYPSYSRIKGRTETLVGRTIAALEGTKVRLRITSNVSLREGIGRMDQETRRFTVDKQKPEDAVLYLIMDKLQRLDMQLLSDDGITSRQELPFMIRPIPDNRPSVMVTSRLEDREYVDSEVVSIGYRAQDDVGLAQVVLSVQGDELDMNLKDFGTTQAEGAMSLSLAELMSREQEQIQLRMIARDTKGQESASPPIVLRLAANSLDRQLRSARRWLTSDPRGHNDKSFSPLHRAAGAVVSLRSLRGRIATLADSLPVGGAISENQRQSLREIENRFAEMRGLSLWGTRWISEYAGAELFCRFRQQVEYALIWAELGLSSGEMQAAMQKACASDPKANLPTLYPIIDRRLLQRQAIQQQIETDYKGMTRELGGYLAATLAHRLSHAKEGEWADKNFVAANGEVLREVLELASSGLSAEVGSVEGLNAALDETDMKKSLRTGISELKNIASALAMPAHTAAITPVPKEASVHTLISGGAGSPFLMTQTAVALHAQADDHASDELQLLQDAFRFTALYTQKPGAFEELGDREDATRRRDAAIWLASDAVNRLRTEAQNLRMGLIARQIEPGLPQFIQSWTRLRECYFVLERAQPLASADEKTRRDMQILLSSLGILENWMPPDLPSPVSLPVLLKGWEAECVSLAADLLPQVQLLLDKIQADLATRKAELETAVSVLRKEMREVMLHQRVEDLVAVQLHAAAVQAVLLKTIDFTQLAQLYGIDLRVDPDPLLAAYILSVKLRDDIASKISVDDEAQEGALLQRVRTAHAGLTEGVSQARHEAWQKVDALLEGMGRLLNGPAKADQIDDILKAQFLSQPYAQEHQAMRASLQSESKLRTPTALLAELAASRDHAVAVWGDLYYRLALLVRALEDNAPAAALAAQGAPISALLNRLGELPNEIKPAKDVIAVCQGLSHVDNQQRNRLAKDVAGILEDMRELVRSDSGRLRSGQTAIAAYDQLTIARAAASLAMNSDDASHAGLIWSLSEAELNRRKAGLGRRRMAMGGLAFVSEDLGQLRLPVHLYQELKRSLEKPMPPLFRDQCYDYLNTILEQAR